MSRYGMLGTTAAVLIAVVSCAADQPEGAITVVAPEKGVRFYHRDELLATDKLQLTKADCARLLRAGEREIALDSIQAEDVAFAICKGDSRIDANRAYIWSQAPAAIADRVLEFPTPWGIRHFAQFVDRGKESAVAFRPRVQSEMELALESVKAVKKDDAVAVELRVTIVNHALLAWSPHRPWAIRAYRFGESISFQDIVVKWPDHVEPVKRGSRSEATIAFTAPFASGQYSLYLYTNLKPGPGFLISNAQRFDIE